MKRSWIAWIIISVVTSTSANESDMGSLLDEVSEIATKTKLNIDYQPSVVSVLHADKLQKIGIRNLHEAMGILPGIETSILHTGWKQVIVRGTYNPDTFVFDKYKLYIDGVDVGSDLYSTSYYYLDFPIELVDRIEVLRGSASTIYGPGAFSAAINVITKISQNNDDKVFVSGGSYDYAKAGFVKHLNRDGWNLGLDGYYQKDDKSLYAGSVFVASDESAYLRSDYNSLERFRDYSVGLNALKDNWKIIARYKSEITGNYYGMSEDLEPIKGGYQQNQSGIIELQHSANLRNGIDVETKLGLNYYHFTFDSTIYQDYAGSGLSIRFNPAYTQLNSTFDLNIKGKNFNHNDWMIGVEARKIDTLKNTFGTTYRNESSGPVVLGVMEYLNGEYGFINGDNDQVVKSIYAQDIYSLNDDVDFSANIRFDDYSLFDSMLSYRIGSVYRMDGENIFKAVYGRSYRAPSYVEAFQSVQEGLKEGNPALKPESIDTYELGYTYKNKTMALRTNIYYSIFKDVIDAAVHGTNGDYSNNKTRNAKGVELEFTRYFGNGSELMSNLTYLRTEYINPDDNNPIEYRSPEISEVMFKGYYLYPIDESLSLNTAWYYSGPKRGYVRPKDSAVETYGSTFVVDGTLGYDLDASTSLTFSIKNLFNEKVIYPSYLAHHDEIVREGRNWLLTYEKRF